MTLKLFCTCGAGLEAEIDPAGEGQIRHVWVSVHSGQGHDACTEMQAVIANGGTK